MDEWVCREGDGWVSLWMNGWMDEWWMDECWMDEL